MHDGASDIVFFGLGGEFPRWTGPIPLNEPGTALPTLKASVFWPTGPGKHRLEPATGNSCRSSPIHVGAAHADVSQSMLPYWVRVMKSKM